MNIDELSNVNLDPVITAILKYCSAESSKCN